MQLDATWCDSMRLDRNRCNLMQLDATRCDLIGIDATWCNLMRLDATDNKHLSWFCHSCGCTRVPYWRWPRNVSSVRNTTLLVAHSSVTESQSFLRLWAVINALSMTTITSSGTWVRHRWQPTGMRMNETKCVISSCDLHHSSYPTHRPFSTLLRLSSYSIGHHWTFKSVAYSDLRIMERAVCLCGLCC